MSLESSMQVLNPPNDWETLCLCVIYLLSIAAVMMLSLVLVNVLRYCFTKENELLLREPDPELRNQLNSFRIVLQRNLCSFSLRRRGAITFSHVFHHLWAAVLNR
ncbi:uncharacterized protein LOC119662464 [Teleopsis dalmanni]|uniref:uncharacterized protein LOC119662464 n=1 Tax=Teleopsis dalmanni TaxID=139649 RepID=UPI0018CE906B|nr:uncharacterized protein LOC119662464 [Teleopsis dalmanni]